MKQKERTRMKQEYPRLRSIKKVEALIIETMEGDGTEESPIHAGRYMAIQSGDGTYKIMQIKRIGELE